MIPVQRRMSSRVTLRESRSLSLDSTSGKRVTRTRLPVGWRGSRVRSCRDRLLLLLPRDPQTSVLPIQQLFSRQQGSQARGIQADHCLPIPGFLHANAVSSSAQPECGMPDASAALQVSQRVSNKQSSKKRSQRMSRCPPAEAIPLVNSASSHRH